MTVSGAKANRASCISIHGENGIATGDGSFQNIVVGARHMSIVNNAVFQISTFLKMSFFHCTASLLTLAINKRKAMWFP